MCSVYYDNFPKIRLKKTCNISPCLQYCNIFYRNPWILTRIIRFLPIHNPNFDSAKDVNTSSITDIVCTCIDSIWDECHTLWTDIYVSVHLHHAYRDMQHCEDAHRLCWHHPPARSLWARLQELCVRHCRPSWAEWTRPRYETLWSHWWLGGNAETSVASSCESES